MWSGTICADTVHLLLGHRALLITSQPGPGTTDAQVASGYPNGVQRRLSHLPPLGTVGLFLPAGTLPGVRIPQAIWASLFPALHVSQNGSPVPRFFPEVPGLAVIDPVQVTC